MFPGHVVGGSLCKYNSIFIEILHEINITTDQDERKKNILMARNQPRMGLPILVNTAKKCKTKYVKPSSIISAQHTLLAYLCKSQLPWKHRSVRVSYVIMCFRACRWEALVHLDGHINNLMKNNAETNYLRQQYSCIKGTCWITPPLPPP